jgi:hypothetical protein
LTLFLQGACYDRGCCDEVDGARMEREDAGASAWRDAIIEITERKMRQLKEKSF